MNHPAIILAAVAFVVEWRCKWFYETGGPSGGCFYLFGLKQATFVCFLECLTRKVNAKAIHLILSGLASSLLARPFLNSMFTPIHFNDLALASDLYSIPLSGCVSSVDFFLECCFSIFPPPSNISNRNQ